MKVIEFIIKVEPWPNNIGFSRGVANGYVAVPRGHPLWGNTDYMSGSVGALDVHGGITYSSPLHIKWVETLMAEFKNDGDYDIIKVDPQNWWVFGFDTAHAYDDAKGCNLEYVWNEVARLKKQLEGENK